MKYLQRGQKNETYCKKNDVIDKNFNLYFLLRYYETYNQMDRKLQIEMNFSLMQVMVRIAKLFVT